MGSPRLCTARPSTKSFGNSSKWNSIPACRLRDIPRRERLSEVEFYLSSGAPDPRESRQDDRQMHRSGRRYSRANGKPSLRSGRRIHARLYRSALPLQGSLLPDRLEIELAGKSSRRTMGRKVCGEPCSNTTTTSNTTSTPWPRDLFLEKRLPGYDYQTHFGGVLLRLPARHRPKGPVAWNFSGPPGKRNSQRP